MVRKFTYSLLGKALEKQTKTIKDQGRKQVEPLKFLTNVQQLLIKDAIPKDQLSKEIQNKLDKIEEIEEKVDKENLIYKTGKYTYNFHQFQTLRFVIVKLPYMKSI